MGTQGRQPVLVFGAALVLGAVSVLPFGGGLGDVVFAVLLYVPFLLALRHVVLANRQARQESQLARRLAGTDPSQLAAQAVSAERVRLSLDIQSALRSDVEKMRVHAQKAIAEWDADPRPALAAMQEQGRQAMSDLRRLLGLLREPPSVPTLHPSIPTPRRRPRRADILLAVLAVTDAVLSPLLAAASPEVDHISLASILLTALVAATVLARSFAPGAGLVIAASFTTAGTVVGHPVSSGLWVIVTVGCLAWACGAVERRRSWAFLGSVALPAALVYKHQRYEPQNLQITLIILGVGLLGGLLVRLGRARAERSRRLADARAAHLRGAKDEALRAERQTLSRDIHDAASGGIGVIVVQAGAAETLLPSDPQRARRALDVALETCDNALRELERLLAELHGEGVLGRDAPRRRLEDVRELVERMRAGGLDVEFHLVRHTGPPPESVPSAAYRVIQESLTNALRHAPGSRVRLTLGSEDGWLRVDVTDDGPGPSAQGPRGYGLVGLGERLEYIGGHLAAGAGPAGGFEVHARVPDTGVRTGTQAPPPGGPAWATEAPA